MSSKNSLPFIAKRKLLSRARIKARKPLISDFKKIDRHKRMVKYIIDWETDLFVCNNIQESVTDKTVV